MAFYIKDNRNIYYHIDRDGYFVECSDEDADTFECINASIMVGTTNRWWAGHYMYANSGSGCICGSSQSEQDYFHWESGDRMMWWGSYQVDKYQGYFYASNRWYEKRDYMFFKDPVGTLVTISDPVKIKCGPSVKNNTSQIQEAVGVKYKKGFKSESSDKASISFGLKLKFGEDAKWGELASEFGFEHSTSSMFEEGAELELKARIRPGTKVTPYSYGVNFHSGTTRMGQYFFGGEIDLVEKDL